MPSVPYITHKRTLRRKSLPRLLRFGLGGSLIFSLLLVSAAFLAVYLYIQVTNGLPPLARLPALLDPPNGLLLHPTRIYDRSATHLLLALQNPASIDAQYLSYPHQASSDKGAGSLLPTTLISTTVASTEPAFWTSPGYTLKLTSNQPATIAECLVSTLLLDQEDPGLIRTLRMKLLAAQVTYQYGREKVLEWYLNSLQFGPLIYGADSAALAYLHKPASQLSLAEAAALTAISNTPMANPLSTPQELLDRQKLILEDLIKQKIATSTEVKGAIQERVQLFPASSAPQSLAPAFTNLVLQQISAQLGANALDRGGFVIVTTLDYDLQHQVQCTIETQDGRLHAGTSVPAGDLADCQAARLLPTLPFSNSLAAYSYNTEVAILDNQTGQILALTAQDASTLQPVLGSHAAGSLFSPWIYLTAFTRGLSPATLAWDIPASIPSGLQNQAGEVTFHGPVRLRTAFANDYPIPALHLLDQMGADTVARTAQLFQLNSIDVSTLEGMLHQIPFFTGIKLNALEISHAYSVFATLGDMAGFTNLSKDQGIPIPGQEARLNPLAIQTVKTGDGQILLDCREPALNCHLARKPVVTAPLAYLITDMLNDESARWPSLGHPNSLEIGRPAGAKVSNPENGQAWTVGFTPQFSIAVSVGTQVVPQAGTQLDPAPVAGALWHAIIQYATRSLPPSGWSPPSGIASMPVCDPSGLLPTSYCPSVVNEVFMVGNEPAYPDTLYHAYPINRESGLLATVFTPPDLVDERIFMVVPPEAESWAQQAGIPSPPKDYDIVAIPQPPSPSVQITSPVMFGSVNGKVTISGSAAVQDFQFYRLQVGKGLNPQEWIQTGRDIYQVVSNGKLGEWDTTGLSGLYALQLQVIHKNQRIETMTIQVTVDNQPPEVQIIRPGQDQTFPSTSSNAVILEATAEDNISLAKVEFSVDHQLVATFTALPYLISQPIQAGKHVFSVKAFDLAGNIKTTSVEFSVAK